MKWRKCWHRWYARVRSLAGQTSFLGTCKTHHHTRPGQWRGAREHGNALQRPDTVRPDIIGSQVYNKLCIKILLLSAARWKAEKGWGGSGDGIIFYFVRIQTERKVVRTGFKRCNLLGSLFCPNLLHSFGIDPLHLRSVKLVVELQHGKKLKQVNILSTTGMA